MDTEKRLSIIKSKVFTALYVAGFVGLSIIALFSVLSFSQAAFNMLWADILLYLLFAELFITAFIQDIFTARSRTDIIIDVFIFPINLVILILCRYVGDAVKLFAILYAAIIIGTVAVRHVLQLRKNDRRSIKIRHILAIALLLMRAIFSKRLYIDETYIAWSLIPAAIITCAAGLTSYLLSREQWTEIFPTKAKRIGMPIIIILLMFFLAVCCSFSAIDNINGVFDNNPTPAEYTVLGKNAPNIFDSDIDYTVTIEINGQNHQIQVPSNDYSNIEKGDTIVVDYYDGALGFPYYKYREKAEKE